MRFWSQQWFHISTIWDLILFSRQTHNTLPRRARIIRVLAQFGSGEDGTACSEVQTSMQFYTCGIILGLLYLPGWLPQQCWLTFTIPVWGMACHPTAKCVQAADQQDQILHIISVYTAARWSNRWGYDVSRQLKISYETPNLSASRLSVQNRAIVLMSASGYFF